MHIFTLVFVAVIVTAAAGYLLPLEYVKWTTVGLWALIVAALFRISSRFPGPVSFLALCALLEFALWGGRIAAEPRTLSELFPQLFP